MCTRPTTGTSAVPTDTEPTTPAEQLADLLDGRLSVDDVSTEVAQLAELAGQVRTHLTLVPPTDAFREALREQVVQAATAPATGAGAAATTTVAGGSGGLSALVAGLAATAVLATSTVAVADRAGPGDLLSGLDRGIERVQLAIANDATDAELLVDFAAERVLEALDLLDPAVVNALLADAEALLDDALALAVAQGRSVEDLLEPYVGALLTLSSRTDDPAVRAEVEQRLGELGVQAPAPSGTAGSPGGDGATGTTGDGSASDDATSGDDAADGSSDESDSTGDAVDDVVDEVEDTVDDVEDTVDDLVDDVTDPLDDATEPVDDLTDDATDPLVP